MKNTVRQIEILEADMIDYHIGEGQELYELTAWVMLSDDTELIFEMNLN